MATATKNRTGAFKTVAKGKAKVERINAGGGIMVDVIESLKANAKKPVKAKGIQVSKGKIVAQNASQPAPKTLDNCYRPHGGYWSAVQALKALGMNKMHPFDAILPAYRKAMGADGWKEFVAVKPRNKKTGKDADGRALQNVSVTARKDYGAPLRAIGYEVRWDGREKQAGLFKVGK